MKWALVFVQLPHKSHDRFLIVDAVRHILIGWFFKAAGIQVFRVVAPCTLLSHLHHLCQWFLIAVQEEHSNCNEGGR